jgi:hypothetical protein
MEVYRHVLAIDSSVSEKSCETFLGTERVYYFNDIIVFIWKYKASYIYLKGEPG